MTGGWLQCLLSENTPMYMLTKKVATLEAQPLKCMEPLRKGWERIDQPMHTLKCISNPSTFLKGPMYIHMAGRAKCIS